MGASLTAKFDLIDDIKTNLQLGALQIVIQTAEAIKEFAQESIMDPSKTGLIYHHGPPPLPHQASAPGEAPANWTHELHDSFSIGARSYVNRAESTLTINAEHGAPLELGTVHMAARPFLQPAIEKARPMMIAATQALIEQAGKIHHHFDLGDAHIGLAQKLPKT